MKAFNFVRLIYLASFIKGIIVALFAAFTPWAFAYVLLPDRLQSYTSLIYWGSFLCFALGYGRITWLLKKETDSVIKPAESLFEAFRGIGSDDPNIRRSSALAMAKQFAALEEDDDEHDDGPTEEEKKENVSRALQVFSRLSGILEKHGIEYLRDYNGTIMDLAKDYEYSVPNVKEALSVLLSHYQTSIWVEVEDLDGTHAGVLEGLIEACNQDLFLSNIVSSKNEDDDMCTVTFSDQGKVTRWNFKEVGNRVADSFMKKAIDFISKKADGRFVCLGGEDSYVDYLFVPSKVSEELGLLKNRRGIQKNSVEN